jgi:short-subunit dehydrogenase
MDDVRRQFEVNTFSPLALVQALLSMLTSAGDGRVVNITSVSGVLATPFAGAYCASKFGLTALSDALRMELAPLGVTVVRIQPGHIQSRFGETAATGLDRTDTGSRYAAISDAIAARAAASQHGATSAEDFAKAAVDVILARTPRPVVTLGSGGRYIAAVARFLPVRLRDRGISRRFRLDELAAATNAQRADAPTGRAA